MDKHPNQPNSALFDRFLASSNNRTAYSQAAISNNLARVEQAWVNGWLMRALEQLEARLQGGDAYTAAVTSVLEAKIEELEARLVVAEAKQSKPPTQAQLDHLANMRAKRTAKVKEAA